MPRTTQELEGLEKPKRAPAKRARSASVEGQEKPKRAPRKKVEIEAPAVVSNRKAPTPLAKTRTKKQTTRKQIAIIVVLLLLGIGGSALVGLTDKGQIDVGKAIADRNAQAIGDNPNAIMIPVQSTTQEPDGGLIGLGIGGGEQTQATTTSTNTATSSASSSEPVGQAPLTNAEAEAAAALAEPETIELQGQ
jgi:hypothetical protein